MSIPRLYGHMKCTQGQTVVNLSNFGLFSYFKRLPTKKVPLLHRNTAGLLVSREQFKTNPFVPKNLTTNGTLEIFKRKAFHVTLLQQTVQ